VVSGPTVDLYIGVKIYANYKEIQEGPLMALSLSSQKIKRERHALGAAIRNLLPTVRSQKEVAEELGLSVQSLNKIECEALAKLFFRVRTKFTKDDAFPPCEPGVNQVKFPDFDLFI
jgi:DNA-binding XRE family transcriptional regulator